MSSVVVGRPPSLMMLGRSARESEAVVTDSGGPLCVLVVDDCEGAAGESLSCVPTGRPFSKSIMDFSIENTCGTLEGEMMLCEILRAFCSELWASCTQRLKSSNVRPW